MVPRKTIRISSWPDPITQERLEDAGFFFDHALKSWIIFCNESDVPTLAEQLKRHHLNADILPAKGQGELKKHPKLSDQLLLKNGGNPTTCALCGHTNTPCRQWIEGDDSDSIDYPNPAKFFMCGPCVQSRMSPHPRLYAPNPEGL